MTPQTSTRRQAARSRAASRPARRFRAVPTATLTVLGLLGGVATGAASGDGLDGLLPGRTTPTTVSAQPGASAADVPDHSLDDAPASRGGAREELPDADAEQDESTTDATTPPVDEAPPVEPVPVEPVPTEPFPVVEPPAPVLPAGVTESDFAAGMLSADVPQFAGGVFDVVPGEVPAPGTGEVKTVRVEIEQGLPVDREKVAALVMATLNDPRSWGGDGSQTFARTAGEATFTVTLASPDTTDVLCAPMDTVGLWSCGQYRNAVLNYMRWAGGSGVFGEDRVAYRQYLVNHEVGHVLGHRHVSCGGPGTRANVMVQQSGETLSCTPNGWPRP